MTEADWQRQVIDLARLYGWFVAHFRPAKTERGWRTPVEADGQGFPDLVLARPGDGVIFAELKAERGRLSIAQEAWLGLLRDSGAEVYLWRPSDFDALVERLKRRSSSTSTGSDSSTARAR